MNTLERCAGPACLGTIDEGYCDVCGAAAASVPVAARVSVGSRVSSPWRPGWRGSGRAASGSGLAHGPPYVSSRDPAAVVMAGPEVPEGKRHCSRCDLPVGRSSAGRPSRTEGFCPQCGKAYSFTPKLQPGDVVAAQYEVLGCLAHGGLGWIYLAVDRSVSDRWVVLKGLLDSGDADAMHAAVAERGFLAAVQHPNIVEIYNFVEHFGAGYIVMEYVDGRSLKDLVLERRATTGESLPPAQVLAHGLDVLRALGHLHDQGLLYCDFKPDNALQTADRLRLIDLGGVRHIDDQHSPIFGTTGFQAPEIAESGPSIGSDLYTVARTMAVLSFEFHGYTGRYRYSLPGRDKVPVLARYESFDRLLRRATHGDRRERFASAAEMAEQAAGVLREVLAAEDGRPRPARSSLFEEETRTAGTRGGLRPAPDEMAVTLPWPRVDPGDQAADHLAGLDDIGPAEVIRELDGLPIDSVEVGLRRARAHIELGELATARSTLASHPAGWRTAWYLGLAALADDDPEAASREFDRVYGWFPGETAPKLALAYCAELKGDLETAKRYHLRVWRTERAHAGAVFGLARVKVAQGDRAGAVDVLASVPRTFSCHVDAQVGAVLAALRGRDPDDLPLVELLAAAGRLDLLDLSAERRNRLAALVLEAALGQVLAGRPVALDPRRGTLRRSLAALVAAGEEALGAVLDERDLRLALEHTYRGLAATADGPAERRMLIDCANAVRPRSLT
ncbi:serine/threonine-protein kinase [Actinomadura rudentiformis]|uniref:serine/threonine-protein kinase n=1 Tax=Actinomadura rudentiformis TaxID=359158 RepID=UPI001CEF829E|nr:serine/threonine-protein kinase [Actinomadura rudentiformis]